MWRKFWTSAVALFFILGLASVVDAQMRRNNPNRHGPAGIGATDNPGKGNQGENPGNGNQGENPGNGNQGENPGNGNQGEDPGNGSGGGTPDGLTPAEEDVCDVLKDATPGLYGLCIAYCEAQDSQCIPDFEAENPVGHCRRRDQRILDRYERKKQEGDPDMPCLPNAGADPSEILCPCWSQADLELFQAGLTSPDVTNAWVWWDVDHQHDFYDENDDGEEEYVCTQFETYAAQSSNLADGNAFFFWIEATVGDCDDPMSCHSAIGCDYPESCPPELAGPGEWSFPLNEEEYAKCKMDVEQLIADHIN